MREILETVPESILEKKNHYKETKENSDFKDHLVKKRTSETLH